MTLALIASLSHSVIAGETDQFYAGSAVIKDSSKEFNDYIQERMNEAVARVNKKQSNIACRYVAKEVMVQLLGEFSIIDLAKNLSFSKISQFTKKSPLIKRFPEETVKNGPYRKQSIYKHRPFPTNIVGIARTLNINGIYIGADKIGHFAIIGKTYYNNFLKALKDGHSEDEAQDIAIKKGLRQEQAILGYMIGGTFSYGDLEANYQGYLFARNMCEGETPYLIQEQGQWRVNPAKTFDIKNYITPKMDEAFNVNTWSPRVWNKMVNEIIPAYCENKINPDYLARAARYKTMDVRTYNDDMIDNFLKDRPKYNREYQLLSKDIECNN